MKAENGKWEPVLSKAEGMDNPISILRPPFSVLHSPSSILPSPPALRRAVFLDRDGSINSMVYNSEFGLVDSPQNADQFQLLPSAPEAIRLINEMSLLAVVVSNQPGIAKGKCTPDDLEAITQKMHRELAAGGGRLDAVYYCLHHPEALLEEYRVICDCRKPKPGLLQRAAEELGIDLGTSYMVGDGLTDVLAGKAVGCITIFLGNHKCELCSVIETLGAKPNFIAPSLWEAVRLIQRKESDYAYLP
jgi:D,D-heptose 1,7-bisphosphate phosphatase